MGILGLADVRGVLQVMVTNQLEIIEETIHDL